MRPVKVIGFEPLPKQVVDFLQGIEPVEVQALLSDCPVEPLHDAVLGRLPGLDELDFHVPCLRPLAKGMADELGAVVAADVPGPAPHLPDFVEGLHQLGRRDAVRGLHPQVLPGALVHHVDDSDPLLLFPDDPFAEEVHRPSLVDAVRWQQFLEHPLDAWLLGVPVEAHPGPRVQAVCPVPAHLLALVPQVGVYQAEAPCGVGPAHLPHRLDNGGVRGRRAPTHALCTIGGRAP